MNEINSYSNPTLTGLICTRIRHACNLGGRGNFASALGMSEHSIRDYERGKRNPRGLNAVIYELLLEATDTHGPQVGLAVKACNTPTQVLKTLSKMAE